MALLAMAGWNQSRSGTSSLTTPSYLVTGFSHVSPTSTPKRDNATSTTTSPGSTVTSTGFFVSLTGGSPLTRSQGLVASIHLGLRVRSLTCTTATADSVWVVVRTDSEVRSG